MGDISPSGFPQSQLRDPHLAVAKGAAAYAHKLLIGHKIHIEVANQMGAGVETVDHPTDGALIGYARKYFKASDRMMPPAQAKN